MLAAQQDLGVGLASDDAAENAVHRKKKGTGFRVQGARVKKPARSWRLEAGSTKKWLEARGKTGKDA
jgi:hypothetical protein